MGIQEVRLARIEARELARIQASPMFRIQGQPPTHSDTNSRQSAIRRNGLNARRNGLNARFRQPDNDDQSRHSFDGHNYRHSIGRLECYRLAVQPAPERVSGPRRHL